MVKVREADLEKGLSLGLLIELLLVSFNCFLGHSIQPVDPPELLHVVGIYFSQQFI